MSSSRESVDVKKWKFHRRAERNYQKGMERIDFEEDLAKEVDLIREGVKKVSFTSEGPKVVEAADESVQRPSLTQ